MTPADWQSLIETFLSGEVDAETFRDDFLEGWQAARDDRVKIPRSVEKLHETVEAFTAEDNDGDTTVAELREEAEAALEKIKAITD